jgi:hypothetical protein
MNITEESNEAFRKPTKAEIMAETLDFLTDVKLLRKKHPNNTEFGEQVDKLLKTYLDSR